MIARFLLALHRRIESLPRPFALPLSLALLILIVALALAGAWILGGEVGNLAVALGADPALATAGSVIGLALAALHLAHLFITALRETPTQETDPA